MEFFLLFLFASFHLTKPMDQWGREFLVMFVTNYDQTGYNAIYVTARQAATVYVENRHYNISSTFQVEAYSSHRFQLTADLHYTTPSKVANKTVYVNATSDISVYAVNYRNGSAGMNIVYPTKTMGTKYVLAAYPPTFGAYFLLVALHNDTTVKLQVKLTSVGSISASCSGNLTDGKQVNVTLNARQVWGHKCTADVTGSKVTSDKPISVMTGLLCDTVPLQVQWCDHMVEAMIPIDDLGRTYILHNIKYRQSGVIYRVTSPYDNNAIEKSTGGPALTLNRGEFKDYDLKTLGTELCITSSKPVMTLMFTKGSNSDTNVNFGDPSMAVVPPVEKFTKDYVVDMEVNPGESFERYVAIIVANKNKDGVIFPNNRTSNFTAIGCDHSVAHVTLDKGSHWLSHKNGTAIGAMLYASGYQIGIATPAGMSLVDKHDYCSSRPCQNGATCSSSSDRSMHVCTCAPGYNGTECQNVIPTTTESDVLVTTSGTMSTTTETNVAETTSPELTQATTVHADSKTTHKQSTILSGDLTTQGTPLQDTTTIQPTELSSAENSADETTTKTDGTTIHHSRQAAFTETTSPAESSNTVEMSDSTSYQPGLTTLSQATNTSEQSSTVYCSCFCDGPIGPNWTMAQLRLHAQRQADRFRELLGVDVSKLSRTIRRLTSAADDRPSASGIGYLGVTFLVMAWGTIVFMDLTSLRKAKVKSKAVNPEKKKA